jgi:hypothetical protein
MYRAGEAVKSKTWATMSKQKELIPLWVQGINDEFAAEMGKDVTAAQVKNKVSSLKRSAQRAIG